jgi:hypothetical protein
VLRKESTLPFPKSERVDIAVTFLTFIWDVLCSTLSPTIVRQLLYDRFIPNRHSCMILALDSTDIPQSFHNETWTRWEASTHPDDPVSVQTGTTDIH